MLALAFVMWSANAGAQDATSRMVEAESAYREGRFDEARQIVDRLASGDDLETLGEARQLLVLRVQINAAMRDSDAVTADLRRLAQLDPDWEPPEAIPPEIRQELSALAGTIEPVQLELTHEAVFGGVVVRAVVRAEASSTGSGLTRGVRLYARTPGGEWLAHDGDIMRVPTPPGTVIEYYGEVVGPGGATVATAGSSDEPFHARAAGSIPSEPDTPPGPSPTTTAPRDPWPIVVGVIVGVAVVAGAVALGIYFGTQEADTPLGTPTIRW